MKHPRWKSIWRYLSHFIGGLAIGTWLCAIHIFVLIAIPHEKIGDGSGRLEITAWWPIIMPLLGLVQAKYRPWAFFHRWTHMLCLAALIPVGGYFCLLLFVAEAFSGYSHD
jgi:hypothetical protein